MGVNSLLKTVTRQRRDCDLNPGPYALESSTLILLPSHPIANYFLENGKVVNLSLTAGALRGR